MTRTPYSGTVGEAVDRARWVVPSREKARMQSALICSAKLIAEAALKRARYLADDKGAGDDPEEQLFGVGCTAAIATDRVRRGEDRAHVAWTDGTRSGGASIWFDKSARTREQEDVIVSAIVLNSIAEVTGVEERLEIDVLGTERLDELD